MSAKIDFSELPFEQAMEIDRLTRLIYDLRENRKRVLAAYGADDETGLLARISSGELPEHPAYDHYLTARVLSDSRSVLREQLAEMLKKVQGK